MNQVRETHYQHVFKSTSDYFPMEDEFYMAKFHRSQKLESQISNIFDKYFKPKLIEFSGKKLLEFDTRCYKLSCEDFYRTHVDDYAGTVGCVYYLNKRWCWDWGGILHIGERDDELTSIFPKFNRLVIHDMKKFRFNHFVSPVTNYAKQSRYSIVSFNK
jgi:Rps23 Pro-64 3,4-dihydroxylase Tpa1-like proline 4-hydroxylase